MKRDQRTVITLVTVFAALAVPMRLRLAAQDQPQAKTQPPGSTVATANYNFLIGSGLLCNSDDSTACPAVAKAANGNTIEINGAGTLNLAHKSVTAAGAFIQKTPTEDIVSTGVWAATELESFESYGLAPGALQVDYPKLRAFGPFAMGLGKMARPMAGMMAGPVAAGGVAIIRIRLLPDAGSPAEAVLQVNCAKGKVPADAQSDGARLTITGGPAFDEQVSGRAIFLLQRPGPNFAWSGK
jgi:hypothetical protein